MPSFAGTTTVFGRFKKNAHAGGGGNNVGVSASTADLNLEHSSSSSTNAAADNDRGKLLGLQPSVTWSAHNHHSPHRRDSSILSLQTNLADIGANVRRSVSLRSHRTNPSSGSSLGRPSKSPNSGNAFSPLSSASPIEDEESTTTGSPKRKADHEKEKDLSPLKEQPALKRKISLTAKGLSHKFKSTEALPRLDSPVYLDNIGRSRTEQNPLSPFSPMLAGNGPGNVPSTMSRKPSVAPSDSSSRPGGLHPQSSYSRDVSSSYSNGAPLSHVPTAPHSIGGALNPNTIYTQIQETSAKRMATIDYVRKLHEGDIFYFSTLHYSPAGLSAMPSLYPHKLGRRATNYFILGYSLPALLDMNSGNPLEYLKALSSLLAEFETYQTLAGYDASGNSVSRGRMGAMFKSGMGLNRNTKGRRSSTATDTLSLDPRQADLLGMPIAGRIPEATSPQDTTSPVNPTGHEFAYLLTPSLPFDPDFNTTLGTLCDTLIDTYAKLMDLVSSPEMCSPTVGTEFSKADKAIRKILVANVVREFEDTTRAGVKGEVAGLGKLVLGGLM